MSSLSDFVVSKNTATADGFNPSKMSGKPCTRKQAYSVAGFTLESFISTVFESDPRLNEPESLVNNFNWSLKARISKVIMEDKKFDSDSCQPYFKDKSKALPKRIVNRITKSFKEHNQDKTPVDKFLLNVKPKS